MRGQREPVCSKAASAVLGVPPRPRCIATPYSLLPTLINPGLSTSPN
ncbi:hypothetical protein [Moorena sp. SIOASIH]|nr:hypothetical protein [Moorena sp. SIOASIH]